MVSDNSGGTWTKKRGDSTPLWHSENAANISFYLLFVLHVISFDNMYMYIHIQTSTIAIAGIVVKRYSM